MAAQSSDDCRSWNLQGQAHLSLYGPVQYQQKELYTRLPNHSFGGRCGVAAIDRTSKITDHSQNGL
eukprot:2920752-Amphidinium_carterae.1